MNDNTASNTGIPTPVPWYAALLVGHSLTGFFAWTLVIRQLYYRNAKKSALLILLANILVLSIFTIIAAKAPIPWDTLLAFMFAANLAWTTGAWLYQRIFIGAAPARYRVREWRYWISPIITALAISVGLAVTLAVFPVLGDRLQMMHAEDILDKQIVLWDFFMYIPYFVPYALLVGFWWAGEGRRFSVTHILTYLAGLIFFLFVLMLVSQLYFFLLYKGHPYQEVQNWPLLPSKTTWTQDFLRNIVKYDQLAFVIAPLLLGTVVRMRDFWTRALVLFPLICGCLLTMIFYSEEGWMIAQGHIMQAMTSPDKTIRASGHEKARILLARYPQHDIWPEFAIRLAGGLYRKEHFAEAKQIYREIATRYAESPRWQTQASLAESALASNRFGTTQGGKIVDLPLINYESYLTPNWMALLQVVRFWSEPNMPESEILIRLKSLSKSEDKIKLSPLPSLSELDDAATSLGFAMLILPADLQSARLLIESDIPLFLPIYNNFVLLNGIDASRSLMTGYSYSTISESLRQGDREEVEEILFLKQEEKGKSLPLMQHIAAQAALEIPDSFWGSMRQKDSAPYMAIIYPESATAEIAGSLPGDWMSLQQKSKGYLAAHIAKNALDAADPIQCLRWSETSWELAHDPFSLHLAYLAQRLWQTRNKSVESRLPLESRFQLLTTIEAFFSSESTKAFLHKAEKQFEADLSANALSWAVRREYADFLDRSNATERALLGRLFRQNVSTDPSHREAWLELAELSEWQDDVPQIVEALEGALQADTWNDKLAVILAYRYIQANRIEDARAVMRRINPLQVRQNPHYIFCRGVLADLNGEAGAAADYYAKAIEMRRYDPLYHLLYAKFLLRQEGREEDARRALQWADRIDTDHGGAGRKAAEILRSF